MKKRILSIISISVVTAILLVNFYFEIANNTSLYDYLKQPKRITKEERAWLQKHGNIIYGGDNNSPPLRFVDKETGQYKGIVVDYLRALSIEIGSEITYEPLVWSDALLDLEAGRTDICDMYPSEERAQKYLFTEPIYNQKGIILVPENEQSIIHYHDLRGKKVAVQKGDYVYDFLSAEVEDVHFVFTPDYFSSILLLLNNAVDAIAGDEPVISYFLDTMNLTGQYKIIDNAIYEREMILAVPKTHKELLNILNYGISILKKKNTMEKIHQKWFGISAPFIKENTSEKILLVILFFLYIIFLSFYLFFTWNNQLKKEVNKRTKELHVSRNDLEITFDGLIHLMIVLDENCNIVNVNLSFSNLVKMEKSLLIGRNYSEFPGILFTRASVRNIQDTLQESRNCQNEFEFGGKIYEMSTFPLKDYNSTDANRVLIMIKDITGIRISEQKILQSNKMSAIGNLAAGVAHEIRNPLGLIRNYCYVLKKNSINDKERFDSSISVIESSVEKASTIIENLLDFSRISANQQEVVNISDLINSILNLEYKIISKQNIKDEIECSKEINCSLNKDSLKHILINLISNAVDAMPDGGLLKLKVSVLDHTLFLLCEDTGTGIKPDDLEKIFNPFFSTKMAGEGTGLGLYVTYNEVQKMGGDIQVQSEYKKGTTFSISIPVGDLAS